MSSDFIIRVASLEDKESVTALLKASYSKLMRTRYSLEILSTILPTITQANPALLLSGTFYLAETKNKFVIGCGGWTREKPGTGKIQIGVGHIRHFATHPEWLKKSVGRKIYERCKLEAQANNIDCLECFSSLNAQGFYATLGFTTVKNVVVPLSNNQEINSVWMRHCFKALN